jgi:hypothetical protein
MAGGIPSIADLTKLMKQARHNANRQRRKEEEARNTRKDIRVSSRFWEQAERDYKRQIESMSK